MDNQYMDMFLDESHEHLQSLNEGLLRLEENMEGVVCVGAPIFDYSGKVVGAVSVSCPTVRGDMTRLLELKDRLLEACTRISADCGYYAAER